MAINAFPAAIQNVIEQVNYLETKFHKAIHAKLVLRAAAAQRSLSYFEGQIGETKTFTRSNPIAPNATALVPSSDTGLDDGISLINRGFEQWQAVLNEWVGGLNLNILGNETLLGDLYIDNAVELAAGAANSIEVVCVQKAFQAYDSGDTFVTAITSGGNTAVRVDNVNGFTTQYLASVGPSYGLPAAVSSTNKLPVIVLNTTGGFVGAANVQGVISDAPANTSYMITGPVAFGQSGILTLDAEAATGALQVGYRVIAMDTTASTTAYNATYKDSSYVIRPLSSGAMLGTGYAMAVTNTIVPTQQITQAVALLSRRQVPRLSNGLYGCAIDATLLQAFYSDPGFQYATMGTFDRSPVFTNGIIAKGWGVEFVEASQLPVYVAPQGGFPLRHCFVFGEDVISEHPFTGARDALSRAAGIGDIFDTRWVDRIAFITQAPLNRLEDVVKMSYKYVGDFEPGTDKGSNPNVVFTSDFCRFKRGVIVQAASAI